MTEYNFSNEINKDYCKIQIGDKYGILNKENQIVIPIEHDDVKILHNGFFAIETNNKWILTNNKDEDISLTKGKGIRLKVKSYYYQNYYTVVGNIYYQKYKDEIIYFVSLIRYNVEFQTEPEEEGCFLGNKASFIEYISQYSKDNNIDEYIDYVSDIEKEFAL